MCCSQVYGCQLAYACGLTTGESPGLNAVSEPVLCLPVKGPRNSLGFACVGTNTPEEASTQLAVRPTEDEEDSWEEEVQQPPGHLQPFC